LREEWRDPDFSPKPEGCLYQPYSLSSFQAYLFSETTMSSEEIPSGHLGNLSKEQKACLKQIWAGIFSLRGNGETALPKGTIDISESCKIVNEIGAERFYSAFWASPVSEHPDLLVLRFLRARKWDVSRGESTQ